MPFHITPIATLFARGQLHAIQLCRGSQEGA